MDFDFYFYQNKMDIFKALLIVLYLFFITLYGAYSQHNIPYGLLWLILATVFFLFSLFFLISFRRKPKLIAIVASEGIILPSYDIIPWHDIAEVKIISYQGQELIGFDLHEPATYFLQQTWWHRVKSTINKRVLGVHITIGNLHIPIKEAFNIIMQKSGFKNL